MIDKNNDPIGKALGLDTPETNKAVTNIIASAYNDSATTDFESARSNIHTVIENGQEAIYKLSEIADQSQHPRAYEVLAKLMDTVLQANKDLLELQSKIREIKNVDEPNNAHAKNVTNNLFVGSTAELQKVIEDMKNK